jgi:hypothetical protein
MSAYGVLIECSETLPIPSPYSTFHLSAFSTSERLNSSPTYLYEKGERALPGDLRSRKFMSFPLM